MTPSLVQLELHLRVTRPIKGLPHFHGAHWNAALRYLIRSANDVDQNLAEHLWVQTVECGVTRYAPGEQLHLGLNFPVEFSPAVARLLGQLNQPRNGQGHFLPGINLELVEVLCRVSQQPWQPEHPRSLCAADLTDEIDRLCESESFTLEFTSPLRLTRPGDSKEPGHRYADEKYFLAPPANINPLAALLLRMRHAETSEAAGLTVHDGALNWLDVGYGTRLKKTIGGVVGQLMVRGRITREQANSLVLGQYAGTGKNAAFGFGYYHIPQLDPIRHIAPLTRGRSLLDRALSAESLALALKQLPNSSPGPDDLGVADYKSGGAEALLALADQARLPTQFGDTMRSYRLPKKDGGSRKLLVQNVGERIVHRSLGTLLGQAVDPLLSGSSYAYRRGLNRKNAAKVVSQLLEQGCSKAIRADIQSFFDTVPHVQILALLNGLFPAEPAITLIEGWLKRAANLGCDGLPQGGSLSPVLSNLFLDRFDRDMAQAGLRLVRYADDFVLMLPPETDETAAMAVAENSLARLGLRINSEKTSVVHQGKPVEFLGYLVRADRIDEKSSEPELSDDLDEWAPLFKDDWQSGQPVYLSTLCRGARSDGANLVIVDEQDHREKIPWARVSRLVVVGRSPVSGGVVYRCVKEDIPITYIDILGRTRGQLQAAHHQPLDLSRQQESCFSQPAFALTVSREIVAAKINNSQALLRRNDASRPELNQLAKRATAAENMDQLRGFEGAAARAYFGAFATLVAPFSFNGRVYRPPDNPVNAMLSFGYTLLYHRIASALRDKGFQPRIGFYHQGRGTHCALASDLLEELRHLVERVVLALIHLKEVCPEDFLPHNFKGNNSVRLSGDAFRTFVRRFERTMGSKFNYGGGGQISYNAYLDQMADNLRRAMQLKVPYKALRIR